MNEEKYPMSDDYNGKAEYLVRFIKKREEVLANMKYMTSNQKRAVLEPLKVMNKSIEALEKHLAEAYEDHRKRRRAEEERKARLEEANRKTQELYIIIKHQLPEKLEGFTKILESLSPEKKEEFFDGVAILEAQNLAEILGEKKY